MKKILIFLDELYFDNKSYNRGSGYSSPSASGAFFDEIWGQNKSYMFPVCKGGYDFPNYFSTYVKKNKCYPLFFWTSVVSFVRFYLYPENRKMLNQILDQAVSENELFWIRQPSLPGLILAQKALSKNKKTYLHIAGEISDAWKNDKYKGILRIPAYLVSKYIQFKLDKLAKYDEVMMFCTGSKLLKYYKKITEKSYFFIDSLINRDQLCSHSYDDHNFKFIFVGRLTIDKGIFILLNVFKKLSKHHKNIQLNIIGFGPEETNIKNFIKNHHLEKIIKLIGFIPNNLLSRHFEHSDIFVLPSQAPYEGFPRVIIEAWASGLAVISTKVGGIEGLGKNGENIIFCDPGSEESLLKACETIIQQSSQMKRMRKTVLKNREEITKEYYQDLIDGIIFKN